MRRDSGVRMCLLGAVGITAAVLPGLAAPQTATAPPAKASPSNAPGNHPEDAAIIRHLNSAITWYRQVASADESAGQPSDFFYLDNARTLARQALQLAFQSADAEAALLLTEKGGEAAGGSPQATDEQQRLSKAVDTLENLIAPLEKQIADLDGQIPKATGKKRQDLTSARDSLQQRLEFNKTMLEAVQKVSTFASNTLGKMGGLQKEIDDLKKSVPELFAKAPTKVTAPAPPPAVPSGGSGLITIASNLFSKLGDMRDIHQLVNGATGVIQMAHQVQSPLRTRMRITVDQGRTLASQPPPPDPAGREAARQKIDAIMAQFKQVSTAALPLTQEIILLEQSQSSLRQWEASAHSGLVRALQDFMVHIAILLAGILIVLGISELWRKATFRYVQEARRRHQLLLVRQIATVTLLALVLIFSFVSQFGSLATFAGFLTAGIAVALQTVILSVVAYFFLIGRQGVKVGDRVTVSGVTGDVIDVGLVRLSMMELSGPSSDLHPTGRVVVVSNAVLFQGTPLFKQMPGTAYAWHEVVVNLEAGSNYSLAESKLLDAVMAVHSQYRDSMEKQHKAQAGLMAVTSPPPSPQARVQLAEKGLDLIVRFPVILQREAEIDDQMAKKVVEVINSDPELKEAVGTPTIRPSSKS